MSNPKISIIVPVYNVERYLRQCIDSILAQTYTDFELLLIDDGSPDNSGNICDEYAKKDPRIRVFHKPNGGVSTARNMGIDNAKGEYISFIDADDYVEPNFLEEMLNAMNRYNADLVCCGVWVGVKADGSYVSIRSTASDKVFNRKEGLIEMFAMDSFHVWPYNKLYKASIIKGNGLKFPVGIRYSEDQVFVTRYIMLCFKVVYISKVLYHYVWNETSASKKEALESTFNYCYLDMLKANEMIAASIKTLHDKSVTIAMNARFFFTNNQIMKSFLRYYDGSDKKTLRLLKCNMIKYYPYYLRHPRCFRIIKRKDSLRLMFRVYFPTLHKILSKTKKKIKHTIHYVKE